MSSLFLLIQSSISFTYFITIEFKALTFQRFNIPPISLDSTRLEKVNRNAIYQFINESKYLAIEFSKISPHIDLIYNESNTDSIKE